MNKFIHKHPWTSFALGLVAIGTLGSLLGPKKVPPPSQVSAGNIPPQRTERRVFVNGRWTFIPA